MISTLDTNYYLTKLKLQLRDGLDPSNESPMVLYVYTLCKGAICKVDMYMCSKYRIHAFGCI
jgi:hypothetical protein